MKMRPTTTIASLVLLAALQLGGTTQPSEDPATRLASELARYLDGARVESVVFTLRDANEEASLKIDQPEAVAEIVKQFRAALVAEDLREGTQRHRPARSIHIRFVVKDGPDVHLKSVGLDMFWAAQGDEEMEKLKWTNLQSPALTNCYAPHFAKLSPTTQPATPRGGA
jgi:hypothetical protein